MREFRRAARGWFTVRSTEGDQRGPEIRVPWFDKNGAERALYAATFPLRTSARSAGPPATFSQAEG